MLGTAQPQLVLTIYHCFLVISLTTNHLSGILDTMDIILFSYPGGRCVCRVVVVFAWGCLCLVGCGHVCMVVVISYGGGSVCMMMVIFV